MQSYRADIDGLRAIAVGAVVLGHAGTPAFSGGFLGVDIFFVISGYLITQVLIGHDGTLKDTLWHFYERRVRRIVPALAVVLAASLIAAAIVLAPAQFRDFAWTELSATGFVANFYFLQHVNYFAPVTGEPLLHLWSLSVEEQFYVFYPVFLWLMAKAGRRFLVPTLIAGLVLSLGLSEYLAFRSPNAAFYFTGSRAWELILGALVALRPPQVALGRWGSEIVAALAAAALVAPVAIYDSNTHWPGMPAFIPCAATAVLIWLHGGQRTAVGAVLSSPPFVALGLISYSLYLWHWPMFRFFEYGMLRPPTPIEYATLIAAAAAAAALSWRFVEQPFRRAQNGVGSRAIFGLAAASAVVLLAAGGSIVAGAGFPQRFSPQIARIYAYLDYRRTPEFKSQTQFGRCFVDTRYPFEQCYRVLPGKRNVILWGDSTSRSLFLGFQRQADGVNLIQANMGQCPPTLAARKGIKPACVAFNRALVARLDSRIDAVVTTALLTYPDDQLPAFLDAVTQAAAKGVRVIVIGPSPRANLQVPLFLARFMQTHDPVFIDRVNARLASLRALDRRMREALRGKRGITFVSFLDTACPQGPCIFWRGDTPYFFDQGHLTKEGSLFFGKALWPSIREAVSHDGR